MSIALAWLASGTVGAVLNAGIWWYGLKGAFGPPVRLDMEQLTGEVEEATGYRWPAPVLAVIGGFLLPPLPLACLARFWWLARRKLVCTAATGKQTFDGACAERGRLIAGGVPEEQSAVTPCTAGDHYHVRLHPDAVPIAERICRHDAPDDPRLRAMTPGRVPDNGRNESVT